MAPSNNLVGYGLPLKEPKLADVLLAWKTQTLLGINCVKIGQIQSFAPAARTASVQILGQIVLKDGTTMAYPLLKNRPVFTLQGGGASLQLPIAAGDQCLILFNDRNLDNWYLNGNAQPPLDGRLHDISDGIVLVGLNWQNSATIPVVDTTEARFILADGLTKVGLKLGKITIQNGTQSLLTILTNLFTTLSTDPGLSPASHTALTTANTALAALLY